MQAPLPYDGKTDLQLIADGDEKAFFEFYSYHANLIRPFLLHYTQSPADVEDIVQETFIKVWLNRDRLPGIENIPGWVYTIASRVFLDHVDREIKRRNRASSFGEALYGSGHAVSAADRTHLQELNNHINRALSNLNDQKKRVFHLNRHHGMKPAQIADLLNMPVGTVKNQLSAALREIREYLLGSGYGPVSLLFLKPLLSFLFLLKG